MAISLIEQLRQVNEGVHYHAPFLNVLKKGKEDPETREKATQMFYDFYAMELMHRLLGSPPPDPGLATKEPGQLTPQQAAKLKAAVQKGGEYAMGAMFVPDWGDVEDIPKGISFVPAQLRKIIDNVYEEVVIQLTRKMMAHLRLTLVSEFRYIVTHAKDWQSFRQKLVAIYNKNNGKISKAEFSAAIAEKIPGMRGHEDAVKRLLKFCKHYDAMSPDPADAVPAEPEVPKVGKPVAEPEPEKEPEPEPEPEEPKAQEPSEPDDTDYTMPPVEIPPGADWGDEPYDYSSDIEKEKLKQWLKQKKGLYEMKYDPSYAAGRISPHTVLAIKQAINASGLTWNDILLAYKNLHWGGAYGGPKWGEGVESFIKLMPRAREHDVEQMAGIVDHIYDLEHNTGELLNKGGMYVAPTDLDRRAKVTSLARYLPNVSPLVQRLILRVLKYTSKHPEIEKDIRKVTQSPTQPFTPEEQTKLGASKFDKSSSGDSWVTQAPYENKKGQTVQNQYTANHHTNGFYSVEDSIDADVQVFETWPEFEEWLDRNSNSFIKPQPGLSHYQAPKQQSAKEKYLSSKVKIKLDADKETKLLDQCKMAWRPAAGSHYYKAYLPGNDRFQFFAFSDGTYMGCIKSTNDIGATFDNWTNAFEYCKAQTVNALPNEDYDEGKAWIGKKMTDPAPHVTPSQAIPTPPSVGSVPSTEYSLSPIEIQTFQILASQAGGVTVEPNVMPEGVTAFKIKLDTGADFGVLTVGKKPLSPTGKKYVVKHAVFGGPVEEWAFANWNQTLTFVKTNFSILTQAASEVKGSVSMSVTPQIFAQQTSAPLPPPSNSKAVYKAHLGLNKPPAHTIRLTAEDEQVMTGLGFEPQMVGSDVWYIHKQIGDTVKFFPNDVAKILFIKTNNKVIITKKIEEALEWLKTNYTGATKSPIVAQPQASNKGSKAGAMYEKLLSDKGFEWEPNAGKYVQKNNLDIIQIIPFPKSTFLDAQTGEKKTFGSLPALAAFLKGYDSLKKKY